MRSKFGSRRFCDFMTELNFGSDQFPGTDAYYDLKGLAQSLLLSERTCTLTATGLVHELFLKVKKQRNATEAALENSAFSLFAGRMMRQILIDRARCRTTRGQAESNARTHLRPDGKSLCALRDKLIELDDLLEKMSAHLPINAELVRLHLYDEISIEDAAKKLCLSRATAYRKWDFSKAWLCKHLHD